MPHPPPLENATAPRSGVVAIRGGPYRYVVSGTEIEGSSPPPSAPTWLRVATPGWWQSAAAEQLSKAMGRVFKPAPFLFAIQGDFLRFDDQAAARYSFERGFDFSWP